MLAGCTLPPLPPKIGFIGIAEGDLQSKLEDLKFTDRFDTDQRAIVGVVQFTQIADGTTVQATWFSPDDRRMPMGRTTITTQSGAKVARFSIASTEDWPRAPSMLDIRAMTGEGERMRTASGSAHFFIGMKDREVEDYWKDFAAWQEAERQKSAFFAELQRLTDRARDAARDWMDAPKAEISFRGDIAGDAGEELLVSDPPSEGPPGMGSGTQAASGAIMAVTADRFALTNMSGALMLILRQRGRERILSGKDGALGVSFRTSDPVTVNIFHRRLHLSWMQEDDQSCSQSVILSGSGVLVGQRDCEEEEREE